MTDLVCAWTHHATARLGERFGSNSVKIKSRIEELLLSGDYAVIEDTQPAPNKITVRLSVADCPLGLVLAMNGSRTIIVTVLPKPRKNMSRHQWRKTT